MINRDKYKKLSEDLLKYGEKRLKKEFNQLVKDGVYKEDQYNNFKICKFCNNKADNSCSLSPDELNKCQYIKFE